jgi:hypothetical protein
MRVGRKPSLNPKTAVIAIPLTPEDKAKLEQQAAAKGVSTARLIRAVMFERQSELIAA